MLSTFSGESNLLWWPGSFTREVMPTFTEIIPDNDFNILLKYLSQVRHFESCFQSSDDKRRIRVLEEDLRMAKEVSVRLHEELERLETKRTKSNDELERTKKLLDESESRRITLQKEVNSVTSEVQLYYIICILVRKIVGNMVGHLVHTRTMLIRQYQKGSSIHNITLFLHSFLYAN